MPAHLGLDDYISVIERSGAALRSAAERAGPGARVPTCPDWRVADLVAHQGMVHRWAAAHLRGDSAHDSGHSHAEGLAAPDPLGWLRAGLDALVETLRETADDAEAAVFLRDAPRPRLFWARRQAHETTVHSVDALAAALGTPPAPADTSIAPALAADGIDELLCGFLPRAKSRLRSAEPRRILVRTADTGHAWSLRVSEDPVVTEVGAAGTAESPDAVFGGTAVQLYLALWNRSAEAEVDGLPELLEQWRTQVRVEWG
ncbi:maleylpyruvate isomerase family mycothiol-dependent enzyme [Streptomonospora sp. PA3]|uniref:maleylpyruvate isomerase family mycothiol-dependent enzyme n=1 Tax=Streptomonospora sp. PA3 TaxID=2607326 RepID=UPI0012DF4726|nr:maleylpyruvate isomerase family mycothiol-dependent enzyme [Streptomonospora sp. PA3]MUL41411.1 maleylpyruvate isomerase family mycothiol-dependent enzyme [Streptomonospora sp. PA3]